MTTEIVYKPCAVCGGRGRVLTSYPPNNTIPESFMPVVLQTCTACRGTGKGAVESIREVKP